MQPRSITYLVVSVLLAGAGPAHAQQMGNGSSANSAAGEKKVCRKLVTSGSRFTEKVCLTKEEWKKVDAEAKS
jgi:hypothetical protein